MSMLDLIRNSRLLRWPLMATSRLLLAPLKSGPALLRRAAYDAMPVPYLVAGNSEHFVVSTADRVIGRELFLHGEFDFGKLQAALAIIVREGMLRPTHLVDVGANIGTIVIPALKRGLMQSATAIEPHPDNLRLLQANLALNGVADAVRVISHAVGAESDATLFLVVSTTNSGNHSIGTDGIAIRSCRLDDLGISADKVLLWMDIEGYEGHALKGASSLLAKGIPVVCEYNPFYLAQSDGMGLFQQALAGRRIFDLKQTVQTELTLDELAARYPEGPEFTDILAIPASMGQNA